MSLAQDLAHVIGALPPQGRITSTSWYDAEPWEPCGVVDGRETAGEAARSYIDIAKEVAAGLTKRAYSETQLDELALLFTLVKVWNSAIDCLDFATTCGWMLCV